MEVGRAKEMFVYTSKKGKKKSQKEPHNRN
jgi:hypothetical protein